MQFGLTLLHLVELKQLMVALWINENHLFCVYYLLSRSETQLHNETTVKQRYKLFLDICIHNCRMIK